MERRFPLEYLRAHCVEARETSQTLMNFVSGVLRLQVLRTDGPAPAPPVLGQPAPARAATALHVPGHGSLDFVARPAVIGLQESRRALKGSDRLEDLGFDPWSSVAKQGLLCGVDVKMKRGMPEEKAVLGWFANAAGLLHASAAHDWLRHVQVTP